nr:PREDICTED: autophagy-related protein 16-1-like [Latimeria chalumnae]|eukprot:XP_006013812.1 PREDICTED: autophagy-related protein 16-1-like [Latimeria chalumnae]
MEEKHWKHHIRAELERRDRNQQEGFTQLIQTYHKLLERLDLQNLLTEKLHLDKSKPEHSCSPSQDGPCDWLWMETAELRIRHQVELKEAHKARGEVRLLLSFT